MISKLNQTFYHYQSSLVVGMKQSVPNFTNMDQVNVTHYNNNTPKKAGTKSKTYSIILLCVQEHMKKVQVKIKSTIKNDFFLQMKKKVIFVVK